MAFKKRDIAVDINTDSDKLLLVQGTEPDVLHAVLSVQCLGISLDLYLHFNAQPVAFC